MQITSCQIYGRRENFSDPTQTIIVEIFLASVGHLPTGAALVTGSIAFNSLPIVAGWSTIPLMGELDGGTEYCVVLRASQWSENYNYYRWHYASAANPGSWTGKQLSGWTPLPQEGVWELFAYADRACFIILSSGDDVIFSTAGAKLENYQWGCTKRYLAVSGYYHRATSSSFTTPPQPKAINPTPEHEATNVETEPSILLQWEPGDEDCPPDSYKVYVGGGVWFELVGSPTVPYLSYSGKIYGPTTTWRVDSIYGATTVTGDEWEFTPKSVFEQTIPFVNPSNPTPIHNSIASYIDSITCKWKGDSRSTSFKLYRSINGGAYEEIT